MNRKQKIIVSITGIFIVLLALVGLTYAYFLTRIRGNTKDKSISVTTANLALLYGDGSPELLTSTTAITPNSETPIGTKTFTVTNTGDGTVNEYAVYLEEFKVVYASNYSDGVVDEVAGEAATFESPKDFRIELTCEEYDRTAYESDPETATKLRDCTGVTNGELPTKEVEVTTEEGTVTKDVLTNGYIVTNSIEKNKVQVYTMELYYDETGNNQSADMNKTLEALIQIYNQKDVVSISGDVTGANEGDYAQINSTPRKSQIVHGKYKFGAVEPGTHTLTIRSKDGNIRGSRTIIINRGTEAGVVDNTNNTTITINDLSEEATVNVTSIASNLGVTSNATITESENFGLEEETGPFEVGTLAYAIYESAVAAASDPDTTRTVFSETPLTNAASVGSTADEKRLLVEEDDFGPSYYFRGGAVIDNYVNLGETCWRIVRIDGDKNVKLLLDDKDHACDSDEYVESTPGFSVNNNSKLGHAYYGAATVVFEKFIKGGTHSMYDESNDNSYTQNFAGIDATSRQYIKEDAKWCMENEDVLYGSNGVELEEGADDNEAYYNSAVRLFGIGQDKNATLKCFGEYNTKISYYLTLDEVAFAGRIKNNRNSWMPYVNTSSYYYKTGYAWQLDANFNYNDGEGFSYDIFEPAIIVEGTMPVTETSNGTLEHPYEIPVS